jgi:hypothetical protein
MVLYRTSTASHKSVSVSDGRDAVGTIEQSSFGFIALDAADRRIGIFQTQVEASRSLPTAGSS